MYKFAKPIWHLCSTFSVFILLTYEHGNWLTYLAATWCTLFSLYTVLVSVVVNNTIIPNWREGEHAEAIHNLFKSFKKNASESGAIISCTILGGLSWATFHSGFLEVSFIAAIGMCAEWTWKHKLHLEFRRFEADQ